MVRKNISSNGIFLSYVEVNEDQPSTIFFIHGNSGSANTWLYQLQSEQLKKFRLIAFDLPGHGNSDEPSDIEFGYSLIEIAKTLKDAINILGKNHKFILVGFSLGSNLVGELLNQHLQPQGIILISPTVVSSSSDLSQVFQPNQNVGAFFSENVDDETLNPLTNECFYSEQEEYRKIFKEDFRTVKPLFRPTLLKTTSDGHYSDELAAIKQFKHSILIIYGVEDKLINTTFLDDKELKLWKSIIKLENAGHFVHQEASHICNTLLLEYAEFVFKLDQALQHN